MAYLLHADPLSTHPDRALWKRALSTAQTVIAHESVLTETVREHADIVFPAEAYPEKEGTITHPDGRLQRLRVAIGRPGALEEGVRATWSVIAEVAKRAGHDPQVIAGPMVSAQVFDAAYPGVTLDVIGGQGARPERSAAEVSGSGKLEVPRSSSTGGGLRVGTWRPLRRPTRAGCSRSRSPTPACRRRPWSRSLRSWLLAASTSRLVRSRRRASELRMAPRLRTYAIAIACSSVRPYAAKLSSQTRSSSPRR